MYSLTENLHLLIPTVFMFGYIIWCFAKNVGYNERFEEERVEKHNRREVETQPKQSVCKRQELPRIFQVSDAELEEAKEYFSNK